MRALLLVGACFFAACPLDASITWACEPDGSCADGLVCVDKQCVAPGMMGGGASGGGAGGGDSAGGSTSGGSAGGSGCVPTTVCPGTIECGYFDGGCGTEVFCAGCAAPQECGVTRPNRCDEPRVCTPEGWCWEHPLPQGSDLTGAFALGPRQVWLSTNGGTVLFWNGEHTSGTGFPTVNIGLRAIHGTAADDLYVVGANRIFHFDGAAWSQETVPVVVTSGLSVVHAAGGRVWAGGRNGVVLARGQGRFWTQLTLAPSSASEVVSLETVGNTLVAVLLDGSTYVARVDNQQLNRVSTGPVFQDVNAALLTFDGGVLIAVGNSGGTSTHTASFEFTRPDAGWVPQLSYTINNTPRAATLLGDQVIIAGATGIVLTTPLAAAGVAPTRLANATRGIQALVKTSSAEVVHAGSGGQFGTIRTSANGLTYQDNMPSVPATDTINDGCAVMTATGPRLVVASDRNRFAERTNVRWAFTDGPAANHHWTRCHFSGPTEVWAVGSTADGGGVTVGVANRRGAQPWSVVDARVGAARWLWVTGFPGGPTYFVPEHSPTTQSVVVNFDGGLTVTSFREVLVDAGINALVASSPGSVPNLFGAGDTATCNADTALTRVNFATTAQPLTAIAGNTFSGGVWSLAVGQNGSFVERRSGAQLNAGTIGTETFLDVWAATTLESYLLSTGPGPQVLVRAADGGVTKEELPIRQARGLFGLDTATGHQVWVTGAEGTILRRDSR